MNAYRIHDCVTGRLLCLALAGWLLPSLAAAPTAEEKFEVLQIGTRAYTNVTVTTKAKNYIFILHTSGMTSIKLSEIPPDLQEKLGYASAAAPKPPTNSAAAWVKKGMAQMDMPQLQNLKKQLGGTWHGKPGAGLSLMGLIGPKLIFALLGVACLFYLFHCYCCMLICRKTGNPGGALIWIPGLQLFPLLRAAGMSGWWFLGFFVPVLNLITQVLWSLNIAKARGKSVWVGVFLLLPLTSLFAFLYLAFSNGRAAEEDEGPEPQIMTLQAA
jgi:hypothetical protein